MNEIAFVMKLKPGYEEEYKRRHDQIWPELSSALVLAGVRDYSIYLDRSTGTLFAVQKRTAKNSADALATQEIVKKWWRYMADIMETNEGNKRKFVNGNSHRACFFRCRFLTSLQTVGVRFSY